MRMAVGELRPGDRFVWATREVTVLGVVRTGKQAGGYRVDCVERDGRQHRLGYDRGETVDVIDGEARPPGGEPWRA